VAAGSARPAGIPPRARVLDLPSRHVFRFAPLPEPLLGAVGAITVLYVPATELTKKWFYGTSLAKG
jgi:hypothetical protein